MVEIVRAILILVAFAFAVVVYRIIWPDDSIRNVVIPAAIGAILGFLRLFSEIRARKLIDSEEGSEEDGRVE